MDLAAGIGAFVHFNFTLNEVKDFSYGIKENGTWNGMIGELVRGVRIPWWFLFEHQYIHV